MVKRLKWLSSAKTSCLGRKYAFTRFLNAARSCSLRSRAGRVIYQGVSISQEKGITTHRFQSVTLPLEGTRNGLYRHFHSTDLPEFRLQLCKSRVRLVLNAIAQELS
jgi:hypothetical protein